MRHEEVPGLGRLPLIHRLALGAAVLLFGLVLAFWLIMLTTPRG